MNSHLPTFRTVCITSLSKSHPSKFFNFVHQVSPSVALKMEAATATFQKMKALPLSQTPARHDAGVADGSASVPTWTKCKYLAIYFLFNLGLTLYNKAVMVQVRWDCLKSPSELVLLWLLGDDYVTASTFSNPFTQSCQQSPKNSVREWRRPCWQFGLNCTQHCV